MRRSSLFLAVLVVALLAPSALRPAEALPPAEGHVTGVVRNEQGTAVPQATVRLSPAVTVPDGGTFVPAAPVASVTTDAGGRYDADVPAGSYDLVVTGGAGSDPYTAAIRSLTVPGGGSATTDIVVVRPWVTFSGKVVDGNGVPFPTDIYLDQPPTYTQHVGVETAADGSFTLSAPPGVYRLKLRGALPNVGVLTAGVENFDLTADRHLTLTVPPLADVEVTVRTPEGGQAGIAYLGCFDGCKATGADLFPGADARFTFASSGKPDSAGKVSLRAFSATGARIIVSGPPRDGMRDVRKEGLTLTAPGSLTVDQHAVGPTVMYQGVLKDDDGTPLIGHVTLTDEDGFAFDAEIYNGQQLQPPGAFQLAVPPGRYRLDVSVDVETVWAQLGVESGIYTEGLFVTLEDFDVEAGRTQDLTVPIADFPVTVLDAEGRPAPGIDVDGTSGETDKPDQGDAVVELFPGGTGRGRLVNTDGGTDEQGVKVLKVFPGAAPPKITVTKALASATKKVARTATSAEVRLPAANQVGGQLRDPGGAVPGFVRMDIDAATGAGFDVDDIRDDGNWGFTAPAGRYTVRFGYPYQEYDDDFEHVPTAVRPAFWWIDTELDVSKAAELDVTLPAADRADVFVYDTDGSPATSELSSEATGKSASVTLAPGLKGRGTASSDAVDTSGAGHLRAPLFGPSDAKLRIGSRWANPFTQAQFSLSPGASVHVALAVRGAAPAPTPNGPSGELPNAGPPAPPAEPPAGPNSFPDQSGYWALGADGKVYAFGDAPRLGDWTGLGSATAIDLEPAPSGKGYWILDDRGRVKAFGDAAPLGDVDAARLRSGERAASLSATPTGHGYWVFTNRGRVFTFGDATNFGDVGDVKLNGPVLDSVATPSGRGYFMVASDGGIFTFGDARFAGSMGGVRLNAPVQSLVPDGDGDGYWLVASDGGIFAFNAPFRGSLGSTRLNKPIRGMVRYGNGYLMVGEDGGIFNFSDRPFSGSLGGQPPSRPVVAVAALP